jgi:hypothetical protein
MAGRQSVQSVATYSRPSASHTPRTESIFECPSGTVLPGFQRNAAPNTQRHSLFALSQLRFPLTAASVRSCEGQTASLDFSHTEATR